MTQEIKIGNYIKGYFGFGCIEGQVVKVNKSSVLIKKYNSRYNRVDGTTTRTETEETVTVRRDRVTEVEA